MHRHRSLRPPGHWFPLLALVGLVAGWTVTALLYALLGQPAGTLAILQARGTRGMPAIVWAGSRELVLLVRDGHGDPGLARD